MSLKTAGLIILLLGELNFTGIAFLNELQSNDYNAEFVFSKTAECIRQADIVIANLEGPLSLAEYSEEAKLKKWQFKQMPLFAKAISNSGIDTLLLANNHIADAGDEGISDTCRHLKEAGISWVPPSNEGPLVINKNGQTIELWNVDTFSPQDSHPWAWGMKDFLSHIRKHKAQHSERTLAIAFIHIHTETFDDMTETEAFFKQLRLLGIQWIVLGGNHKPSELSLVAPDRGTHYGLGDFVFGCECSGESSGKALALAIHNGTVIAQEAIVATGHAGTDYMARFVVNETNSAPQLIRNCGAE